MLIFLVYFILCLQMNVGNNLLMRPSYADVVRDANAVEQHRIQQNERMNARLIRKTRRE